jgi:hypothetical protein
MWTAVVVVVMALVVAGYMIWKFRDAPTAAPVAVVTPTRPTTQTTVPLGGEATSVVIPPLAESDPVVAELVRQLSSHPRVTAWLATKGLVRNFVVVVANIAEGAAPAKLLRPLRPDSGFRVVDRNGFTYIDSRSYDRYTPLADAVASVDPKDAANLYATLKPRLEEAHRELGEGHSFDRTLERAITLLLKTPIPTGPVAVVPRGIGYAFADDNAQSLTAAQRQLLRLGPENARRVQAKLREIALALGISTERLPGAAQ